MTQGPYLDIGRNRANRKHSRRDQWRRLAWALAEPIFSMSPRPFFAWRRVLLRAFGAKIGRNVHVYPSVRVFAPWQLEIGDEVAVGADVRIYNLAAISIGRQATVSQGVHLCAGSHDYTRREMPLVKRPISIGEAAWLCADAFVGPGATVGDRAVVAARSVVVRDVPPWVVVAGNPARVLKPRRLEPTAPDAP